MHVALSSGHVALSSEHVVLSSVHVALVYINTRFWNQTLRAISLGTRSSVPKLWGSEKLYGGIGDILFFFLT